VVKIQNIGNTHFQKLKINFKKIKNK